MWLYIPFYFDMFLLDFFFETCWFWGGGECMLQKKTTENDSGQIKSQNVKFFKEKEIASKIEIFRKKKGKPQENTKTQNLLKSKKSERKNARTKAFAFAPAFKMIHSPPAEAPTHGKKNEKAHNGSMQIWRTCCRGVCFEPSCPAIPVKKHLICSHPSVFIFLCRHSWFANYFWFELQVFSTKIRACWQKKGGSNANNAVQLT